MNQETTMIPYHEYQPYGKYCVTCGADDTHPSHWRPVLPAPDAGSGEWRVRHNVGARTEILEDDKIILAAFLLPEHAEQIVRDHNTLPQTVAILTQIRQWLTMPDGRTAWPEIVEQINAALTAAGVQQ